VALQHLLDQCGCVFRERQLSLGNVDFELADRIYNASSSRAPAIWGIIRKSIAGQFRLLHLPPRRQVHELTIGQ